MSLTEVLCHTCSVSHKHCRNVFWEILIFLSCMHAKGWADYGILMTAQGLVRSMPPGVAVIRQEGELPVAF